MVVDRAATRAAKTSQEENRYTRHGADNGLDGHAVYKRQKR